MRVPNYFKIVPCARLLSTSAHACGQFTCSDYMLIQGSKLPITEGGRSTETGMESSEEGKSSYNAKAWNTNRTTLSYTGTTTVSDIKMQSTLLSGNEPLSNSTCCFRHRHTSNGRRNQPSPPPSPNPSNATSVVRDIGNISRIIDLPRAGNFNQSKSTTIITTCVRRSLSYMNTIRRQRRCPEDRSRLSGDNKTRPLQSKGLEPHPSATSSMSLSTHTYIPS